MKLDLSEIKKQQAVLNPRHTTQTKNIKVTWENVLQHKILSQAKIDIASHKAKKKLIIGAKGTGKSIIPIVKSIVQFENDPYFNVFGFRKYKEQATSKMSELFYQAYSIFKMKGFQFPYDYELKSQRAELIRSTTRQTLGNQAFRFGSLDNASGSTDGGAPTNGGYFGIITIDEPVIEKDAFDTSKIPSKSQWDKDTSIILDNLDRFNDNFTEITQRDVTTEIYFTMNNWGDHPLILYAESILSEKEFIEYIFQEPIENFLNNPDYIQQKFSDPQWVLQFQQNNTLSRYDEKEDTLVSRMQKFANPNNWSDKRREPLLQAIQKALAEGDYNQLTILLGTKAVPEIDTDMLSYNIKDYNTTSLDTLTEDGWRLGQINYSWDIDTSRVLTLTPTIELFKQQLNLLTQNWDVEKIIYIDKQVELPAMGSGQIGELNDVYVRQMQRAMTNHYNKLTEKPLKKAIISVDDKRKWFLHELFKQRLPWQGQYKTFDQHGEFEIGNRQDWTHIGFENKVIYMNPKNKALMDDFKVCVKRDKDDHRRKTTSTTNYLDRIDSFENGFIPFLGNIIKSNRR